MVWLDYPDAMGAGTVDWAGLRAAAAVNAPGEGLRERKKRQMRQQLSDTATEMFLDRGFDAVRVTEIAEACDVSEKTVFNYFPTKESLILDMPAATMAALRTRLADPALAPIEAALQVLGAELENITTWLAGQQDPALASAQFRRFGTLIQTTPSLRAYQRDLADQLVAVATEVLADRVGMKADEPEPKMAAIALLGLWQIQFGGLRRYLDGIHTPVQVRQAVTADVHRAAGLIAAVLSRFAGDGHA